MTHFLFIAGLEYSSEGFFLQIISSHICEFMIASSYNVTIETHP